MARFAFIPAVALVLPLALTPVSGFASVSPRLTSLVGGTGAEGSTYEPAGGDGSLRPEDCAPKCDFRCSATSHRKPCLFFCNMCCKKCLCVPSGTYGHKEECPCYDNWKNQQGGPKCP